MFSVEDLQEFASSYLAEPIKQDVESGKLGVADAIMAQTKINKRLDDGRRAIAAGQGIEVNDAYFEDLQKRALDRRKK